MGALFSCCTCLRISSPVQGWRETRHCNGDARLEEPKRTAQGVFSMQWTLTAAFMTYQHQSKAQRGADGAELKSALLVT